MIRRISTKWVLTVLAAVVLPFLGFAWVVNTQISGRMWDTVRYYLLSIADDLRGRIDNEIHERRLDVLLVAEDPLTEWAFGPYRENFEGLLQEAFDGFMDRGRDYDLLLLAGADGRVITASAREVGGAAARKAAREWLAGNDFGQEPWFSRALAGEFVLVDQHISPFVPPKNPAGKSQPENYHIGFAAPVYRDDSEEAVGVVFALMNWSKIQHILLRLERPGLEGVVAHDIYSSSYAWLWRDDCDTIIGHTNYGIYGQRVSEPPIQLPELVEAARSSDWGMYPEYTYLDKRKNAAFAHTRSRANGGFGWVVGIGIDNEDIYATVDDLRELLGVATLSVLGVVVLGTILIARRTTRPIVELHRQIERVASGDLETQVEVQSQDELGALARAFNQMTRELTENREQLVRAEKDAAWREMARQVAHEIKNPLTPISLSVDFLKRMRDEQSPDFDRVFDETISIWKRQIENMRTIASDFHAFAGAIEPDPERIDAGELVDEVLALDAAWAAELGVEVERRQGGGVVLVDRGELRRVLINIISNALESMPDGGRLVVSVETVSAAEDPAAEGAVETAVPRRIRIVVRDTGCGLSEEARERLFEPYFTTRTHGTGLGLAIARRLLEQMNGTIALVASPEGDGTIARVEIPAAPEARAEEEPAA